MAKLSTNLMSSEDSINVFCEDMGAYLKITTGGVSGSRFIVEVVREDDGEEVEEFVSGEYPLHPDSVEVDVSYELTVHATKRVHIEFESKEDYESYKADPAEYIRENDYIAMYSTADSIEDSDYYEIHDAEITEVEEH